VQLLGTRGRIELEIPFSPLNDLPSRILIASTGDLKFDDIVAESFATADQYTLQGDAFARAVFADAEVPVPLEDSIGNMAVIEAIFRSANSGQWETVQQ
jgi:predicted dehydrogenase